MRAQRILGLLVAGALFCGSVGAQEPTPQQIQKAADAFDEGSRAFKNGRFEEAAELFESADRLAPNAAALANAIRARKAAKQGAKAATLAAMALARFPDDAALRTLAQGILNAYERQYFRAKVNCQPACSLLVDDKVFGASPQLSVILFLEPGEHTLKAGWSHERSKSTQIQAQKGGSETISLEAPPLPPPPASSSAPPPPPPPPASSTPVQAPPPPSGISPWFFFAGLGATAVVGGLATWSGLDTLSNPGPDRVRESCAGKDRNCPLFQEGLSKERRTDTLLIVTGVVGVATGVVAFFTNWKASPLGNGKSTDSAQITPWIAPGSAQVGGVSLGVHGQF